MKRSHTRVMCSLAVLFGGCNAQSIVAEFPDADSDASEPRARDAGRDAGSRPSDAGSRMDSPMADTGLDAGTDAGADGGADAGADGGADAGVPGPGPTCAACRDIYCRDYMGLGVDLVGGCYERVDAMYGADPEDTEFLADCQRAMACAYASDCGYEPGRGAVPCYCGDITVDACISAPAPEAACRSEFMQSARTTDHLEYSHRYGDLAYPVAWAVYLLECDTLYCDDAPEGDCTP